MAQFVKLPQGYVNVDNLTKIEQQVGGAYRLRWSDGMVNVIPSDEGNIIVAAIENSQRKESTARARKTTTKSKTE
jgi:hypothetical protein